jgi:ATP-binding cassette, subfamily C, bacterial
VHKQKRSAWAFYGYFIRTYPIGSALMVMLMFLAGMAEGFGVLAFLPVLELGTADGTTASAATRVVTGALGAIGLEASLGVLLLMIVVAICVKAALLWLADQQVGSMVAAVVRDLRLQLIRALFAVRWRYFAERKIGQFANAITSEVVRIGAAYREASQAVAAFLQMCVYFAIAAAISWKVAFGTLVIGAAFTLLLRSFFQSSRSIGGEETNLGKTLTSRLLDVLQGLKPLKAMARHGLIRPILESETESLNRAQRRQVRLYATLRALHEPLVTVLLAGGLYFTLIVADHTLASVLVLAFVFYRLMQHINTLQMRYHIMVHGEGAFVSFMDELDSAQAQREVWFGQRQAPRLGKDIRFESVAFSYGNQPVLADVDVTIPAGSFVAVTGESGSGKTTLADLIAGLLQPDSGTIYVDDVPLDQMDLESWRRTIGYVPQEMLLLNDTIFKNVTLGDSSISGSEVEQALRSAGAWNFVTANALGMDQSVGERGTALSGGQRQRIAIARALIGRPSLLILDEVTTSLDPATEAELCETLRSLAGETTVLAISHQPAIRSIADTVLTVAGTRVVAQQQQLAYARMDA